MRLNSDISVAVAQLADELNSEVGVPLDEWAVAVLLEAKGLRDVDVQQAYDLSDLFKFAELVYRKCARKISEPAQQRAENSGGYCKRLLRHLWAGSFFAMPMLGQIVCLLLLRYSLWASLDFSELQATVIGLGTLTSFTITGGLVMCIGRQGSVYKGQKDYKLLQAICNRLTILGVTVAVNSALVGAVVQALTPILPAGAFLVAVGYHLALSALWLALGVLYMLGQHQYTFVITVAGAIAVTVLVRVFAVHVYLAQIGAISAAAAAAYFVGYRQMRRLEKRSPKKFEHRTLPPLDVLVGGLLPFFVYGATYFSLLLADRGMAWTAPGRAVPKPVWFHTPYELGMDWGLLSLLLPMAYLEHVVNEFGIFLEGSQKRMSHAEASRLRLECARFIRRSLTVLCVLSFVSVAVAYFGVIALQAFDDIQAIRDFFSSPITPIVYWLSAVAYQFLTMGLMIGLLFFTLGRSHAVIGSMTKALGASIVVGFAVSRVVEPHFAVAGFVAGAVFFWSVMLWESARLSRDIDHVYYAAF